MQLVREAILTCAPSTRVELAFLEFMQPELSPCVERLVAEGVHRICVLPLFIAQGGHLKRDLPLLLEELRQRHSGLQLDLCPPVGEAAAVIAAMAGYALEQFQAPAR